MVTDGPQRTDNPALALGLPGAMVLLVGVGTHIAGSRLPDVPAAKATVTELGEVFVQRCGLARDRLRVLVDPRDPIELGRALDEVIQRAEDVLLVYYVGHGLLDPDGNLYLATQATDDPLRGLAYRAFPCTALRDALAECRARSIVAVLDCCFSGRADAPVSRVMVDSFDRGYVGGGYVLASAAPESVALAPVGARYTAFSGEVVRLLREGDPTAPPELTLDRVYESLWRTLPERGFPRPHRRSADRAGEMILAANPAYQPPAIERRSVPSYDNYQQQGSPYRGLAAFQAEDAPYFFGRERAIENLVRHMEIRIRDGGPLVVVGPSGVGKSSLLRAGLLPALGRGLPSLPQVRQWPPMVFVPGPHPLGEFAQRIARVSNQTADVIRAQVADDPGRVRDVLRAALAYQAVRGTLPPSGVRCVLVVDQFEALFTTCADAGERTAFIRALVAACEPATDSPAVVVLSVRADFYGQCSAFPELVPALQDGQIVIGPMTMAQLRDAIEKPAHATGLALEEGLSDLLLRDAFTGGEAKAGVGAGVLPLLSHALLETWQQRDGRLLTLSGYQATGGIWQALARTADDTYHRLDPAGRQIARNLLLRMVRIGDGTDDTRRRVPLADLMPTDSSDQVAAVLNSFAEARLVTLDADAAEITHDAVLHAWPLLREWIDTDRAGLLLAQRLREAAEAWDHERRDPTGLYRGVRLDTARQWAEDPRHLTDLTPTTHAFLDASTAAETEERRAARRRTNRLRTLVAILAVLFLVAAGTGVVAVNQTSAATRQRDLVASRLAAQAASTVRATDPALAMQLALAAYRLSPTSDAASSLDSSAVVPFDTVPPGQHGQAVNVAYSPDGHLLAAYSDDHTLRLWDVTNPYRPHIDAVIPRVGGTDSAFSPNSHFLVAGGPGGTLRLWDVSDPNHPVADAVLATNAELPLYRVSFSPDGRTVAATGVGTLHLWDVTDPRHPITYANLTFSKADQFGCSFSADGRVLATVGSATSTSDLTVRLWDLTDIYHPVLDYFSAAGTNTGFDAVAFSSRGRLLAVGGSDVELWDATDPKHPQVLSHDSFLSGNVTSLAFSPDGRTLAVEYSASQAASVSLVDVTNPGNQDFRPFSTSPLPTISHSMAFSPDGATLVTGGDVVRLWHAPEPVVPAGAGDGQWDVNGAILAAARPAPDEFPNGSIGLWNLVDSRHVRRIGILDGPQASQLGVANQHVLVSYSAAANAVQFWDIRKPPHPIVASTIDLHTSKSSGIATGPGGLLVAADTDNTMGLWNFTNPYQPVMLATFPQPAEPRLLEISPDGRLVLVIDDHDVRIWNIADPRHPVQLTSFANPVHQYDNVAVDPKFHLLVLQANVTIDNTYVSVKLWNIADPRHRVAGPTLSNTAQNIALSPDGRTLAVSDSVNDTTTLWDVTDPVHPRKLSTITTPDPAEFLVFGPDGTVLVTGSSQSPSAQLWDVHDPSTPTQRSTITLPDPSSTGQSDDVQSLGFGSSDQTVVISGQENLYLMDSDPGRLAGYLCSLSGNTITQSQWQQYLSGVPYQPPCG